MTRKYTARFMAITAIILLLANDSDYCKKTVSY